MKIRWNRSSLRLRITPRELAALERGESVQEGLQFPGAPEGWLVVLSVGGDQAALYHDSAAVQVRLSSDDLTRLAEPEREGVYFMSDDPAFPVAYYVEKDYPCTHPRPDEVQALSATGTYVEETFPAPTDFAGRK